MIKKDGVTNFRSESEIFAEDLAKYEELKKSDRIEDKLTLVLMDPHVGTGDDDPSGLWYTFAKAKALAIMKRFNVTDNSSSL